VVFVRLICLLGLCQLLLACSAYDEGLLAAVASGPGNGSAAGSGAQSQGGSGGNSPAFGGNGGPADVSVGTPDAGPSARCGDGVVSDMEKCDTAIAKDMPGACPTECQPLAECAARALNGSACQSECVLLQAGCAGGDGCCPGNCTHDNDSDCSKKCGDGIVEAAEGETCEPEPAASASPDSRCATACDDGDACTTDVLTGSAANCNAACTTVAITALADGDGCCPDGANVFTDADCSAKCGNGVREPGEDCDGTPDCNPQCDLGLTTTQRTCLDSFAISDETCARCTCLKCAQPKLDCFTDTDAARGMLCRTLQSCVQASGCYDSACYCGTALNCIPPSGPCKSEVEAASGTTNGLDINTRKMDTNYAVGRSLALDVCVLTQCASECP